MRTFPDIETLARQYMGGLAHVHTRLSNYRGHHESNQTITSIIETLQRANASGLPRGYVMINEHASNPVRPRKLGRYSLRARRLIRKHWQTHILGVPVLHGFEASILPDGTTDLTEKLAANCEMVVASRHGLPGGFYQDEAKITRQLLAACRNKQIDVIGHPLRHIEQLDIDWPEIFRTAARTGTVIEVNLNNFPQSEAEKERYEIWRDWLHKLGASKCRVSIGSDLHNTGQLESFIEDWKKLADMKRPNRLRDLIVTLSAAGIIPERVVNANYEKFTDWLALDKPRRAI